MLKTRSHNDRRTKTDRRVLNDPNYAGPEQRSDADKRYLSDRRYESRLQIALSCIDQEPVIGVSVQEKSRRDPIRKNQGDK